MVHYTSAAFKAGRICQRRSGFDDRVLLVRVGESTKHMVRYTPLYYSTVTLLAKLRGLSTSKPLAMLT